jgi:hypothetical protein
MEEEIKNGQNLDEKDVQKYNSGLPFNQESNLLVAAGQRKINLIWERTQAFIAVVVVCANLIVGVYVGLFKNDAKIPDVLTNSLFLVVGFYFSRTNHNAVGGVSKNQSGR